MVGREMGNACADCCRFLRVGPRDLVGFVDAVTRTAVKSEGEVKTRKTNEY